MNYAAIFNGAVNYGSTDTGRIYRIADRLEQSEQEGENIAHQIIRGMF